MQHADINHAVVDNLVGPPDAVRDCFNPSLENYYTCLLDSSRSEPK